MKERPVGAKISFQQRHGKAWGHREPGQLGKWISWDNWNEGLILGKGIKHGIVAEKWKEAARSSTPEVLTSEDCVPGKHVAMPIPFYVMHNGQRVQLASNE